MQERKYLYYDHDRSECMTKGIYWEVRADCRDWSMLIPVKRDVVLSQPAE